MQRPPTPRTRAVWPVVAVMVPLALAWAAFSTAIDSGALTDADADALGRAAGLVVREHWQVTLGLLAAGTGALLYRSRRVLTGR